MQYLSKSLYNVAKIEEFAFNRVENMDGKGAYHGDRQFLLYPKYFQRASTSRSLKIGIV